jgi:hypothetical protein
VAAQTTAFPYEPRRHGLRQCPRAVSGVTRVRLLAGFPYSPDWSLDHTPADLGVERAHVLAQRRVWIPPRRPDTS